MKGICQLGKSLVFKAKKISTVCKNEGWFTVAVTPDTIIIIPGISYRVNTKVVFLCLSYQCASLMTLWTTLYV